MPQDSIDAIVEIEYHRRSRSGKRADIQQDKAEGRPENIS